MSARMGSFISPSSAVMQNVSLITDRIMADVCPTCSVALAILSSFKTFKGVKN